MPPKGHSNNPSGIGATPSTVERVVTAQLNEKFAALELKVKEIDARSQVMFHQLRNLAIDVQELTKHLAGAMLQFASLTERPELHGDLMAIVKDFVFQVTKKK